MLNTMQNSFIFNNSDNSNNQNKILKFLAKEHITLTANMLLIIQISKIQQLYTVFHKKHPFSFYHISVK